MCVYLRHTLNVNNINKNGFMCNTYNSNERSTYQCRPITYLAYWLKNRFLSIFILFRTKSHKKESFFKRLNWFKGAQQQQKIKFFS